jgi:hypothetical protein
MRDAGILIAITLSVWILVHGGRDCLPSGDDRGFEYGSPSAPAKGGLAPRL